VLKTKHSKTITKPKLQVVKVNPILLNAKVMFGVVLALLMVGQVMLTLVSTLLKLKLITNGIKR
jgi:hypothetical protein